MNVSTYYFESRDENRTRVLSAPDLPAVVLQPVDNLQQESRSMDLISKPRGKSSVWLYFGLKADENGQPLNSGGAICRLCRKVVLAKGGNTTNLRSHLMRRHRADFFETTSSTTSGALFETQGDSHTEFRALMVECK